MKKGIRFGLNLIIYALLICISLMAIKLDYAAEINDIVSSRMIEMLPVVKNQDRVENLEYLANNFPNSTFMLKIKMVHDWELWEYENLSNMVKEDRIRAELTGEIQPETTQLIRDSIDRRSILINKLASIDRLKSFREDGLREFEERLNTKLEAILADPLNEPLEISLDIDDLYFTFGMSVSVALLILCIILWVMIVGAIIKELAGLLKNTKINSEEDTEHVNTTKDINTAKDKENIETRR